MIELRPMAGEDLPLVARWLREPHVARWWDTPVEVEIEKYRRRLGVASRVRMLTILERRDDDVVPIGWCEWHAGCGVIVDPDASNIASRRVLELAGFAFVELRPWPDGSGSGQMATYRLAPATITAP